MSLKGRKRLDSEHYAQSPKGMWIKTQLTDDGIELLWQVRTRRVGGEIHVLDSNGDLEMAVPCDRFQYGDVMRSAGVVPLDDAFLSFCGEDRFEEFANAAMRHIACMLATGYGDTPEQIVEWWSDLNNEDRMYIGHGEYKFLYDCEPFVEIIGLVGTVYVAEDNTLNVLIGVRDSNISVALLTDNDLVSFIISTIPV